MSSSSSSITIIIIIYFIIIIIIICRDSVAKIKWDVEWFEESEGGKLIVADHPSSLLIDAFFFSRR
jgi:hypothetical protein